MRKASDCFETSAHVYRLDDSQIPRNFLRSSKLNATRSHQVHFKVTSVLSSEPRS